MTARRITAIVVGAGPAGLAMGRELARRGIDHLILDRGRVGEAWRQRPWAQLRLRTPNWMNGLPGAPYHGRNRHGFMAAAELVEHLDAYAGSIGSLLAQHTEVLGVRALDPGFEVSTTSRTYRCRTLILATGACAEPAVPALARGVPAPVFQTTPARYTCPEDLPEGRVLVVGAGASGVAIASEIQCAGREVVLAVGNHRRLPRRYRDRDIDWWLDAVGWLDERIEAPDSIERQRLTPSPQLNGSSQALDLASLQARGVEIVGRLMDIRDGRAVFSPGLASVCAAADLTLARLCERIDAWAARHIRSSASIMADPLPPTPVPASPRRELDLNGGEVAAIVWATGFRPNHSFVHLPVFDRSSRLVHEGGVVAGVDGLFALGLPFLRRHRSPLISGVGRDACDIAEHLERHLKTTRYRPTRRRVRAPIITPLPAGAMPQLSVRGA